MYIKYFYMKIIIYIIIYTHCYYIIKKYYYIKLTLDSSAVSDNVGGSSKQKNSLTHETPMRTGLLNIPLTNV